MKRLLALLLTLALLVSSLALLTACKGDDPAEDPTPTPTPTPDTDPTPVDPNKILVPAYKDYGRGTVNYSELVYERPNVEGIIEGFDAVTAAIEANEVSFDEQIALIEEMEDDYTDFLTMHTLSSINNSRDSSDEFWLEEYTYLLTNYSSFSQAIEDMYVACAQSEHRTRFEDEYFEFSLEDYVDGGDYTDELVALMEDEAELVAQYNGLSTSTVVITLPDGTTGTLDELMEKVPEGEKDEKLALYTVYYQNESTKLATDIYIELVKIRMLIADELGKDSYIEVAYEDLGHDYTAQQMKLFLCDIRDTVAISSDMYYNNFYHLNSEREPIAKIPHVANKLYELFGEMDTELQDIYAYMLQHGLYDIEYESDNRLNGAFTTYIYGNNSPFIFMTAGGRISDYVTLSHEFGHFADNYINEGGNSSLDLAEVYSQALSNLMLLAIEDDMCDTSVGQQEYKYMLHNEMSMISDTLMYQGYLAMFEHLVYELDYEEVTKEKLESLMKRAQLYTWGYNIEQLAVWDAILMPHTIEYPFYVQSYCTSLVAAVNIMLLEIEKDGKGLEAYKTLIHRDDSAELTFEQELARAGINSPLAEGALMEMFEGVYLYITGKPYSTSSDKEPGAA